MFRALLLAIVVCSASAAHAAALWEFDFQPKRGALMEGFAEVNADTDYTPAAGYGFVGEGKNSWPSGGAYPDPLLGDWIRVRRMFQVDVPQGAYEIRLYLRSSARYLQRRPASVRVNGRLLYEERITPDSFYRDYYKNEFADYRKDDDIYEKYIQPMCQPIVVQAVAPDGKLKIGLNEVLVFGVAILPAQAAAPHAKSIEDACRQYFKAHYLKRREHLESAPKPTPTREDADRGYTLFAKHYLEEVYPNTNPRPWDIKNEITAFASWDEFEPFAFSVYPLRDLKGVRVRCTDFIGPGSAKIGRADIDVRVVRYKERKPYPSKTGLAYYTVAPEILVKRPSTDIEDGVNRTFWITVHVPNGARPGGYEATATVEGDNARPSTVKLRLRVLPIKLLYPENRHHWTGAYPPVVYLHFDEQKEDKAQYYAHVEAELRDILNHGFTEYGYYSTWLPAPELEAKDGRLIRVDFTSTARVVEIYRKVGMPVPPITMKFSDFAKRLFPGKPIYRRMSHGGLYFYDGIPDFEKKAADALNTLVKEARAAGMPRIEMSLPDEPHGDRLRAF